MTIETLAILMPGDMGHGCAKAFQACGFRVVTNLTGRSGQTLWLSREADIEDLGSLEEVARQADLILSILPPEMAMGQATSVANAMIATGCRPPYADCNAISPASARRVGVEIARAGATYVGAGIIGFNPMKEDGGTRFYVSGPDTSSVETLNGRGVVVRRLGEEIGRASAMKMVYAGATKGTFSLHAAVLTTAHMHGLTEDYLKELDASLPNVRAAMERMVPRIPLDAKRWLAEMREISETFAEVGVTPNFHAGVADVMELADRTPIAAETRETIDESRTLAQALDMYVAAIREAQNSAE